MSIAPQFQRYLDSSYNNLEIDLDEIEIADPPRDDSHTTRMELEELDSIVQEAKLPRDIMQVADKDPLRLFYSVAKKKGLDPLEEEAKLWADDWTKLSFEFKLKFKRRRPYEVKKEHDVEFAHHKTDTSESPSYPSGHAMMAYGVAEFYKDKYPLMAGEWDNVADIIAHSRLQMGVHYPSDVEASKSIVRQVAEQTKEASYARLARSAIKRNLQSGKGVKVTTQGGGKRVVGNSTPRYTRKKTPTPTPQTWGQKFKGYGASVGNWASENPVQASAAAGATGLGGYMGVKKFTQPKPQPMGMPKMGSLGHLEQRRSERAKFMSKEELLKLEKQVRNTKGLPDGSHYITLPHGRKGVVRTEEGRSHLATILDARMRPPGRDLTNLVKSSSGHSKEARALFSRLANMARTTPTGTAIEIYGRQAGKGLRRGAQRGLQKGTQAARGVYTSPKLFNASYFVQKHLKPEMADDIGGVVNLIKGGSLKTAAEKLRLYHGSPLDLETLEPRQPNKGAWGEPGVYGSTDPLVAALYAIARNDSRGSWGILPDGRLIAKSKKELNPEGYVYEYESDDYIAPPEDDPGIGYATQSTPKVLSKKKVYLDQLQDSITRVDDRDKFLEYFKKTSAQQPTTRPLAKLASLPSLNSILKATQAGLSRAKLDKLADKVHLYRARRNLGLAVKDLDKYKTLTGRFGQMPRIVIPKTHLDIPDLYRLGFQDSLVAVPEIGQKRWTTYRHPLDRLHLHDHGKYLNMHIDSLPALQMIAERNSLSAKARRKLMETIPEGVKAWSPEKFKEVGLLKKLNEQLSGVGHAVLEGGPGYINYGLKQLNPWKVSMAEEIISKLPKDYLKKRYGITKVSSEHNKLAAPNLNTLLLEKTSSDQPLLRHRSTLLIRDPKTNKLLAAKETDPSSKASPFFFPGGGLYDDEYDTPRNPSDEEIIEGARREALEELGIHLDNPRVVGSYAQELEDWWKAKALKNRGVPYVGGHEHYVLADKGKEDRSAYNVEGDAFEQGDYYDPAEIVEALSRAAKSDSTFAPFNKEQVRAIRDNLLTKTSSIDLLTGRMGAGKSTLLSKVKDQYDIVEGTDLGSVVDGKFVEPSDEDKPRLRQEKADRLLAAHKAGKRVLMEGYPPGLFRIPGMVEAADRAVILEPDLLQRLMQIGNRSKERGTSIEEDIRFAVSPEHSAKEQKYLDMLRESIAGTHVAPTSEAAEEYLLKKNASDLSVLTAVPKQNLDLIMRKGLYSQKAMLDDPEVLAAFLAQRNADKAWKNDEQYDEKRFREQYDKRLELMDGNDAPLAGPSVFFTEPDPDKVSDPRHFVNKFDTQKLRVNLGKLLADIPETHITGAELIPSSAAENMTDEEFDQYVKDRRRDITLEEAAKYIATDPKELWKHYKDEYLGRYYAADVPHAFIRTPSGIIPPEYLEPVEKTSSQRLRTTIFGVDPEGKLLHGFGNQGFYKFPGGGVDPGESIVDAAKRELLEEAGYDVESIEELPGLDTSDSVGASSAKGHMGHGSSLTKYLLARLGKRNESLLGSEGDAISNLQTASIDEVLGGLEGDMLFGSGVAESNHAALSRVRDMLQKTSSAKEKLHHILMKTGAYKDYRPRGTLYLLDGKGGVMADKPTADYNATTPYFFPGGGIFEEEKVDRLPTSSEIVEGIEREALEELGTKLKNVRVLQDEPANVDMPDWWRERQKKKRGVDYKGIAEFFAAAERGDQDKSIYGADNDEFKGTFYPIDEVASALEANAKPGDDYYEDSMRQARLLRSLLEKTSSAKEQLKHILITGQSGSGKTTEAKRLGRELSMPVIHLDEQKGFGAKGVDPDYIEDLTEATQDIIGNLDKPHIVEGTQLLSEQFPLELLRSNDLRILEADEDELVRRLTERGWNTESGRDLKGPDSADEARHVAKHQRKSVDSLVERLKKKAALEDEFQPDLTPDDLKALGVYDQVYGDAPSEASMKEWPEHWIHKQDPLGWLQWYDRYSGGRRTDDDARQIKRWKSFKARHLAQYLKKPTPRRAAALRNWGIDVEKY